MSVDAVPQFDVEQTLESIQELAAQRPVAARIIAVCGAEDADAKALATFSPPT